MVNGKIGDTVYLIESNKFVRKATIINIIEDSYLIKFDNGGGMKVRRSRLFESEEEANLLISHYKWKEKNLNKKIF